MRRYAILLLTIASFYVKAQQNTPHVSGKVKITMAKGLIECNLNLSNLPDLGKQYKILLNRGFNIHLLKDDTGKVLRYDGYYNSKLQGEASAYTPSLTGADTLKLPSRLSISYTGAFPVFKDTLNSFDFKGYIALNGKTLRAAEQTKWYPVIYDIKNDKQISDVTYDITVECEDCKTIYINGTTAQAGPLATFKSDKPYQLLLFTGDYSMQSQSNSSFLNANLTDEEASVFDQNITSIKNFYTQYLNVPYDEKIVFLQHSAVTSFSGHSWGFVTFPTIAIAGTTLKSKLNLSSRLFKDTSNYNFYAHELGHYYYGQLLQSNATLKMFFLESMAEFLSIKATEAKYDKTFTVRYISKRLQLLNDKQVVPLSQITNPDDMNDTYRYDYAPLLLLAMEKRFGEDKVKQFCRQALNNTQGPTDYNYFLKLVKLAGINGTDWKAFQEQVINQKSCKNVFNYL
jgi:hypothetical protein